MALSKAAIKARGIAKAKNATRLLTGDKELDAKLGKLKVGASNKIARPAITKALRICRKSIQAEIPSQFKDAKRAIGMVNDKKGGRTKDQVRAKTGVGVGKAYKAQPKRKGNRPGVGIGGKNLLWWVLGTEDRATAGPDKLGRPAHTTGNMPPQMPDIVKNGFNKASSQMMSAIRQEAATRLAREAAK